MRVTQSMYYKSLYGTNNSQLNSKLFDVNKQIASGIRIQYANEDVPAFSQTMRLDNEITTLSQITKSTETAQKFSDQTDVVLNEFEESLSRMRTLLLQAANDTNDELSRDAIAKELRGLEKNLKNLSNTSINGQYLFSGSAVDVKPISDDGTYNGNDKELKAILGSHSEQTYNISGAELFLGEEKGIRREVTSNVQHTANNADYLTESTTMDEFMGAIPAGQKHYFYLRGAQSDGTAFNARIELDGTSDVNDLLKNIGEVYGNNGSNKVVEVTLQANGQIVVADKLKGSSKLDFHMVGASDFGGVDESAVTDIDDLALNGTTNYNDALTGAHANQLYIREFNKSGLIAGAGSGTPAIMGDLQYDRTMFSVTGNEVTSNVSHVLKRTNTSTTPMTQLQENAFATGSTKLSDVADLSQGTADTLDGTQLVVNGTTANTGIPFSLQIDLNNTAGGGSTFSLDGGATNYDIFDVGTPRSAVNADDMTYQQLLDVVNMVITGSPLPDPAGTHAFPDGTPYTAADEFDYAIETAESFGDTYLTHDGKIAFTDLLFITTQATMSMHDSNSGSFNAGEASVLTFNTNNSLAVRDPKIDFFERIDDMITSVENYILYPDHTVGNQRIVGIENAIAMMDDLQDHVFSTHAQVGANSNALETSLDRTQILKLSTENLRSSVIDTDLAEASLTLTQLTLNYEAMLSTVGRVSQLSLVNYL